MPEPDSMIRLSLSDAARNCHREGATAVLTMRSGVQVMGKLKQPGPTDMTTAHIKTRNGGWATLLIEEIAIVEARTGT